MQFYNSITGPVPYATLSELASYTPEQIAKFGEATFDEVVQLTIIREHIYQESALLATTNGLIETRAMDRLEAQIFAPSDDAVTTEYPVPPESIAPVSRKKPVTYNLKKVDLNMAETRYFLSNDAKLRGAYEWLRADSARRATEHLAETRDKHILTELSSMAPNGNDVSATAKWASNSANVEADIAEAIGNIISNSNIPVQQLNKNPAFAVIMPAEAWPGVTKLKLIRNITAPVRDFIQTEYKVELRFTRKPRVETSWPIDDEALVVPLMDPSIGFLGTFDGAGIIPAQEIVRDGRGDDIFIRQWFRFIGIPEPLDGSTTTNARIAKITGVT